MPKDLLLPAMAFRFSLIDRPDRVQVRVLGGVTRCSSACCERAVLAVSAMHCRLSNALSSECHRHPDTTCAL